MSNTKNTNLNVAKFALECVKSVKDNNKITNDEYNTLVKKMPTLIQKNGYISTLVFNLSKKKNPHHMEVLNNIVGWNCENDKIKGLLKKDVVKNYDDLKKFKEEVKTKDKKETSEIQERELDILQQYIEQITNLNQNEYRLVTKEMMILFGWIKRFSEGILIDKGEKNEKNTY